jgi:hypothetical protein
MMQPESDWNKRGDRGISGFSSFPSPDEAHRQSGSMAQLRPPADQKIANAI